VRNRKDIEIGLMGLGVIGSGVSHVLIDKSDTISRHLGCPLILKKALDCDVSRKNSANIPEEIFTTDASNLLSDPDIDIVIEVIGGDTDAYNYIKEAISQGKHVVTANKEVIAKHGPELAALASEHHVEVRYEASVGGGIPIVSPLKQDLQANTIRSINAIINGTTNYIVTRMAKENANFATVLKQAQELGYAEANPANDIEGTDAVYKLAILATLAFRMEVHPDDIFCEGISKLASRDFRYAQEFGYAIKLLAIAKQENDAVQVRVHPALVSEDVLLAKVDGVFNAIEVEGDLTGKVIFYGRGAGPQPTSSAIIADVLQLANDIKIGMPPKAKLEPYRTKKLTPISDIITRYYLRLTIDDQAGVLAQISRILGDHSISIASAIQKEADVKSQTAEIVIMTHPSQESSMQKAMHEIEALSVVREIGNLIRVTD
jgi:homoserine dehydrogenase